MGMKRNGVSKRRRGKKRRKRKKMRTGPSERKKRMTDRIERKTKIKRRKSTNAKMKMIDLLIGEENLRKKNRLKPTISNAGEAVMYNRKTTNKRKKTWAAV